MSTPDIILPLTSDPAGPTAHVWIEAVEITRQGQAQTPGLGDAWALALPLRASLGMGDQLLLDAAGREIPTACPLAPVRLDVARLVHHPRVAALLAELRDVCLGIATGEIAPAEAAP